MCLDARRTPLRRCRSTLGRPCSSRRRMLQHCDAIGDDGRDAEGREQPSDSKRVTSRRLASPAGARGLLRTPLLVVFTQGTYDALIWRALAEGIHTHGLLEQYRLSAALNHPPLAAWIATRLLEPGLVTGIPFRILFRVPTALVDLGSVALISRIRRGNRYRWVATGLYAVHPVALIFSAYHGNTDSVIAFFLLLCVWVGVGGSAADDRLFTGREPLGQAARDPCRAGSRFRLPALA